MVKLGQESCFERRLNVEVSVMLKADERKKLERDFIEAEASLALEGFHPSEFGVSLKTRVLAGDISLEQAQAELLAHYTPVASRIA